MMCRLRSVEFALQNAFTRWWGAARPAINRNKHLAAATRNPAIAVHSLQVANCFIKEPCLRLDSLSCTLYRLLFVL
jgi:hypothetical protein